MQVMILEFTIYIPWSHSLKEKRAEVRSLKDRLRNRFNVSVAESHTQDVQQTITLMVASLCANGTITDRKAEHIERFVEENTDGQIMDVIREDIAL